MCVILLQYIFHFESFSPFTHPHRSMSFTGFRDMPMAAGMTRKPSTCSLPASLLMERGLTPSSSFEGFSPTGSTCSLDKFGSGGAGPRMTTPSQALYRYSGEHHHERQASRSSCSSVVIEESDAAILKAVPLPDTTTNTTDPNDNMSSKTGTLNAARKHTKTVPSPKLPSNNRSPGGTSSNSVREPGTSWADQSSSNDTGGGRPDWAILPSNGEIKHNGTPPFKQVHSTQSKISGGVSDSHHIIPIRTHPEQSNPFQQYSSVQPQNKSPHTPQRSRHTPVNKRNSSEGGYSSGPTGVIESSPTRHKTPAAVVGSRGDWNPAMQQSTLAVKRTYPGHQQQQQAILRVPPPHYVNGVLKPVVGHHVGGHGGVLLGYSGVGKLVNHRPDPVPVTCFNCGKRGHHGITCPANTMDTNNPESECMHNYIVEAMT